MALRKAAGLPCGELMRDDAMPCSKLTRACSAITGIGAAIVAWPLCFIHYGTRITWPRMLRWQACLGLASAAAAALQVQAMDPACEPQNVDAYDQERRR